MMGVLNQSMPIIYSIYDDFIKLKLTELQDPVLCKKTCSACCSHFVASVEPFELIFIDYQLKKTEGYSNLIYQLSLRHKQYSDLVYATEGYDEDKILFEYYKKEIACPYLTAEQNCSIYEQRPMPCRMFFSLSNPNLCKGALTIHPDNKNFIIELSDETELVISQLSEWFGELELSNLFFIGMLKVNELFGSQA